jgi:hypothetical protein
MDTSDQAAQDEDDRPRPSTDSLTIQAKTSSPQVFALHNDDDVPVDAYEADEDWNASVQLAPSPQRRAIGLCVLWITSLLGFVAFAWWLAQAGKSREVEALAERLRQLESKQASELGIDACVNSDDDSCSMHLADSRVPERPTKVQPAPAAPPAQPLTEESVADLIRRTRETMREAGSDVVPLLSCAHSEQKEWAEVRSSLVSRFGMWQIGVVPEDLASLRQMLDASVEKLHASGEFKQDCDFGRVCLLLLAMIANGEGRSALLKATPLQAELMSLILGVPWSVLAQTRWPIFGLLAQLHLHTHGEDDIPRSQHEEVYFEQLKVHFEQQDSTQLASAGVRFIDDDKAFHPGVDKTDGHAMPTLCALTSQLLSPDVVPGETLADEALSQVQGFFSQAVWSIDDLHATVISVWPLHSILHAAMIRFSPPD